MIINKNIDDIILLDIEKYHWNNINKVQITLKTSIIMTIM